MTTATLTNPRMYRFLLAGLLMLFVGLSIQYSIKVLSPRKDGLTKSAILRWSKQLQAMEDGENIHKAYNYPNPPIMALLLWPISELADVAPLAAALTWFYIKVAMALMCMFWVMRLCENPDSPFPPWAMAIAIILSIRPILGDLSHGNVNIFILFLVIGGLYAFRQGYDVLCGLLIALSIACKVTPALFIGYFLWKGAWRVLGGVGLGLALFFLVIPGLVLGWTHNLDSLTAWFEGMVLPFVIGGQVTTDHPNQSLPGVVYRLLTNSPSFSTYIEDIYTPTEYHNFVDIGTTNAKWLVKGIMGLFVLLVLWLCRQPIRRDGEALAVTRANSLLGVEFGIILVGMLVFSERTWKHHCVTLLMPIGVLCYAISAMPLSKFRRAAVIAALALSALLIALTSTGIGWDRYGKLAQVYGAYLAAFGLLICGMVLVMLDGKKASEG